MLFCASDEIRAQLINEEADKGKRFLNYFIDLIILYILSFFGGIVFAFLIMVINPEGIYLLEEDIVGYLIFLVIGISYFTLMEATTGRTIAKYITKTKVVHEEGHKISFSTALIRSVSRFVPFDSLSFLGSHGWHDKWSNTKVVKVI